MFQFYIDIFYSVIDHGELRHWIHLRKFDFCMETESRTRTKASSWVVKSLENDQDLDSYWVREKTLHPAFIIIIISVCSLANKRKTMTETMFAIGSVQIINKC